MSNIAGRSVVLWLEGGITTGLSTCFLSLSNNRRFSGRGEVPSALCRLIVCGCTDCGWELIMIPFFSIVVWNLWNEQEGNMVSLRRYSRQAEVNVGKQPENFHFLKVAL